jgi:putative endonuclease
VLCFVEVKTRSGLGFGEPAEAVSPQKARRLRVLAGRWLTAHRTPGWSDLRFDVVSVLRTPDGPCVTHLEGAF